MFPKGVHPDVMWEFGISDGNVTRHSFCETFAGEITEDSCCVDEDVTTFFCWCAESWDAFDVVLVRKEVKGVLS